MPIHLDLDNARHADQKEKMLEYLQNGTSPFMPEQIEKDGYQKIIKKTKHWYITTNRWPYEHTKYHYLIIANQYWTQIDEITPEASSEIIPLVQWLCRELKVPGGAVCLRFGDTNYSGGTVDHLHWQFIVPDLEDSNYERVHFAIGKSREKLK